VGEKEILHYVPEQFDLTVGLIGTGDGKVTSSPVGIDCETDCTQIYLESTVVTLVATPDADSVFKGWSGGGCSGTGDCAVAMYANELVTAEFATVYTITATAGDNGSISPSGSVIVEQGSNATFTMTPASKYYVDNIYVDGRAVGSFTTYTFKNVRSDHTISVIFENNWETFETGGFDQFPWRTGGSAAWKVQGSTVHRGNFAAQAPTTIEDSQESYLEVTLCVELTGKISFWYKVSSEINYDFLIFRIDGIEMGRWSGEIDWTEASYSVNRGIHSFTWVYSKDDSTSKGSDTAWIDDIVFPKAQPCKDEGSFFVIPNKRGGEAVIYLE
jgi:hypothetical protein